MNYEEANRKVKAARITGIIDGIILAEFKMSPREPSVAGQIAQIIGGWEDGHWARAAVLAGCRPPSTITRKMIVDGYRQRARSIDTTGEVA